MSRTKNSLPFNAYLFCHSYDIIQLNFIICCLLFFCYYYITVACTSFTVKNLSFHDINIHNKHTENQPVSLWMKMLLNLLLFYGFAVLMQMQECQLDNCSDMDMLCQQQHHTQTEEDIAHLDNLRQLGKTDKDTMFVDYRHTSWHQDRN